MACVVSRLLDSVTRRAASNPDELDENDYVHIDQLTPLTRDDIVHAAVLHDVGHMPFSHATENVLMGQENIFMCGSQTISEFTTVVQRRLSKSIRLGEALSLVVILSKRFSSFYNGYVRHGAEDPDALLRIACLISGLPPDPRLSGAAELISASVIDADKIDYVNRDAYCCGIPVGVDVSRIFLRSGFLKATRARLLQSRLKDNPAAEEILFVVNASGLDTVDEITQARAALYQRVYLHAVTRTAESIYGGALEVNASSSKKDHKIADALSLWAMSDDALLATLILSNEPEVVRRARKLRNRQLPKKAGVFSSLIADMHMPLQLLFPGLSPSEAAAVRKQVVNTPLEELTAPKIASGIGRILQTEIRSEVDKLVAMIPAEKRAGLIPKKPLELLELIGSAYMDRVQKDCIVLQNGELLRTSQFTNIREQQDAFDIFKAVGFVMCDSDWRALVLLAARTVLCRPASEPKPTALFETTMATELQNEVPSSEPVSFVPRMILDLRGVIRRSGVAQAKATAVIQAATDAGYFDDKPLLAKPLDPEDALVRKVVDKLQTFEGQRSWRIRNESVAAFVDQFPPRLRSLMLEMLTEELIYFDRAELGRSLLSTISGLGPVDVTALTPNSGSFTRMIVEQESDGKAAYRNIHFHKEIEGALPEGGRDPLVLIDDNISSATQARSQFLSWAGIPRGEWPDECQDEDGIFEQPLSKLFLDRMRQRPIFVAVCAGRAEASENLKATIEPLGFSDFRGVEFTHAIDQLANWPESLRVYMQDVGRSLMAWARFRKSPEQLSPQESTFCDERAFGYGNVGGLVATILNVPTATATAIWCPGMHRGSPWMPLLIRRNKLRHLVIG
jgi:deoxynucleoside triphosphate triphosphohydrolase SAMHD1